MKQTTFAGTGFELVTKRTREREFLEEMNLVVPWTELVSLIQFRSPLSKTGRPPFPVSTMLRIHFMQQCLQGAGGNIKSGKLRPLAITSLNRSPIAMDIPTLSESGYPKFELTLWYALTGPKGISQEILDILNREVKATLSLPDVNEKLTSANTDLIGSSP